MEENTKLIQMENPPPLVSIVVLAYNHLDYTKLCVESLYKYTVDVDFELITIDNGSTDETKAYFGGLPNTKKISFPENIGVDKAINYGFRIAEGKYTLNLSNDIVVTSHWLGNLVACMEANERVAMVVPVCGASSNNQQVNLNYHSLEEMQLFAQVYNQSDPNRWEERLKLVTYTCLFKTDVQKAIGGFDEDFNPGAYDDDAIGFRIRRAGYKLILAKDTYVHHFGSITFNEEYKKNDIATKNRCLFTSKFGVDSWAASMIDFNVVDLVDYNRKNKVRILGIGKSCGSTLLQIKNSFRKKGIGEVTLFYLAENERCLPDLLTICEDCLFAGPENVKQYFGSQPYDLIVVESETDKVENPREFFEDLSGMLKEDGQLITTATDKLYPLIEKTLFEKGLVLSKSVKNYYFYFARQS